MLPEALDEINQSNLPASTCRNALQLLALAHDDNGHLMIAWDDLADMWHISVSRSRKHLGAMQSANLLHYSSNGDGICYINFKAWTRAHARKTATERPENARPRAENDHDDSVDDQEARAHARKTATERPENARGRAENGHDLTRAGARALTDRLTDDPLDSNVSQSVTPDTPGPDERRQTVALLREIRIDAAEAERIAIAHPFYRVRDCVAAWWMNRKSAGGKLENSPGIIIYWLNQWPEKEPNAYVEADWRRTELYRAHRTPDEVDGGEDEGEAERRRKYIGEEFSDIAIG